MTFKEEIVQALQNLGGQASLSDIYDEVEKNTTRLLTDNFTASIRGVIERHSSDSESYNNIEDLFYSVYGIGKGVWGLREYNNKELLVNDLIEKYRIEEKERFEKLREEIQDILKEE